jgi:hypothetical protein
MRAQEARIVGVGKERQETEGAFALSEGLRGRTETFEAIGTVALTPWRMIAWMLAFINTN